MAVVKTNPKAYLMLNESSRPAAVLCRSSSVILWRIVESRNLLKRTIRTMDVRTNTKAYDLRFAEAILSDL